MKYVFAILAKKRMIFMRNNLFTGIATIGLR